jgi:hypothetical protein
MTGLAAPDKGPGTILKGNPKNYLIEIQMPFEVPHGSWGGWRKARGPATVL